MSTGVYSDGGNDTLLNHFSIWGIREFARLLRVQEKMLEGHGNTDGAATSRRLAERYEEAYRELNCDPAHGVEL